MYKLSTERYGVAKKEEGKEKREKKKRRKQETKTETDKWGRNYLEFFQDNLFRITKC